MLKAYCDGCGIEVSVSKASEDHKYNCDHYCSRCENKANELLDWRSQRWAKLQKQLDEEFKIKKKEIFGKD